MRTVHRILCVFVVLFTLYLGITGAMIQTIDLHTLYTHPPANDPMMMAIREGFNGPGGFEVIETSDYAATALPAGFDYVGSLDKLEAAAPALLGEGPWDFVELRALEGKPVGLIQSGKQLLRFELSSDQASVGPAKEHENSTVPSLRNTVKHWHRMTPIGGWVMWINPIIGLALGLFIVSGFIVYFRLLLARRRIKRRNWFWSAGGTWRTLHRWVSLCAALFLTVVAVSGTWLAVESLGLDLYFSAHRPPPPVQGVTPAAPRRARSPITPLQPGTLLAMLDTVLSAQRAEAADEPIKAVRLRTYGGMPQGVLIAGRGEQTEQKVFNASTGVRASESEPGYPATGFPFGWQAHQIAKSVHRGDYIGLSGRWMDLLAGLALIYLSISGIVMYLQMWSKRRREGRGAFLWI